jgi:phosphate transport system substrate-binding protein
MRPALLAALIGLSSLAVARADSPINGAGSTFDYPIFWKWFDAYAKVDPASNFNYLPVGSGLGVRLIVAQTIDFGASDAPMTDKALADAPGSILNLPVVAGGVAVVYNLEGNPKLRLDADALAGIFLGNIAKWNDPALMALNPQVALPDKDIAIAHRSDSSGTTFIFTDYLSSVSDIWKSEVGKGTSVKWPRGTAGTGNEGVAEQVRELAGAIGYVELAYAKKRQLQYADIKNAAGDFVSPTPESISAALADATIPDDFRFSIINSPGKAAYPIASASWILIYKNQKDAEKGKKLVQFIKWAVTDGQKLSQPLDYAPIPFAISQRVLRRLDEVVYADGQPVQGVQQAPVRNDEGSHPAKVRALLVSPVVGVLMAYLLSVGLGHYLVVGGMNFFLRDSGKTFGRPNPLAWGVGCVERFIYTSCVILGFPIGIIGAWLVLKGLAEFRPTKGDTPPANESLDGRYRYLVGAGISLIVGVGFGLLGRHLMGSVPLPKML